MNVIHVQHIVIIALFHVNFVLIVILKTTILTLLRIFVQNMKKIAVIFFTLLYLVSTSGIAYSSFYCCGKLKETYLFTHYNFGKDCKGNKKDPGCCDTKTFFAKVKDHHTPSTDIKVIGADFNNILHPLFLAHFIFQNESIQTTSFAFIHAPPLISKQPVYLSVCNFRI